MPVLSRAVPSFREMYVSLLRLGLEQLHSDWDCGGERSLGGLLSPTLEEGGHTGPSWLGKEVCEGEEWVRGEVEGLKVHWLCSGPPA